MDSVDTREYLHGNRFCLLLSAGAAAGASWAFSASAAWVAKTQAAKKKRATCERKEIFSMSAIGD